jgi:hypothetical protein
MFSSSILTSLREFISDVKTLAVCCNNHKDEKGGVFEGTSGDTYNNSYQCVRLLQSSPYAWLSN